MGRFAPITPAAAERVAESALAGASLRVHVDVEIPGTGIKGRMRILTRAESLLVKADALALFKERGMINRDGSIAAAAIDDWKSELAVRHLAVAVRLADAEIDEPLAPVEDWRDELSDEQISGPWDRYQDLLAEIDPLGDETIDRLTASDVERIREASKKKDVVLVRSFGLHKLALYAITTAAPSAS